MLDYDVSEFVIDDDKSIFRSIDGEEEVSAPTLNMYKSLIFPFIKYLEGSYFGDVDIMIPGVRNNTRDSTAIAAAKECHLFVLSKEVINSLRKQFGKEIRDMEKLAVFRRRKHKKLITLLSKKIQLIHKAKPPKRVGNREYYEQNLMEMEEMNLNDLEEQN